MPLSRVVEVEETSSALDDLFEPGLHPPILLRIGGREIGRSDLPRTPRRLLDDVLQGTGSDPLTTS